MLSMIRSMTLVAVLSLVGCDRHPSSAELASAPPASNSAIEHNGAAVSPSPPEAAVAPHQGSIHLSADFTRDGLPEDIRIEFLETEIQKPFTWVLTISTKEGKVLHSERHNDEGFDEIVSDPEHVGDCTSYEDCKRRYYFELLPRNLSRCLKPSTAPFSEGDRTEERLKSAAFSELHGKEIQPANIDSAIAEMKNTLSNPGFVSLCIPDGPDVVNPPMIWVDVIQKFVTYYRP